MALTCLIVDDNARYAEAARALLEFQGLTVVGMAASGDECAWLARRFQPDVVLVDVHLGDESGFDIARQLAAPCRGRRAPSVILISTRDERDFLDLIEASPAIGFLAKAAVSAAAIEDLLARPAGGYVNSRPGI
jgi:DNA-binding NarL/FixJ family response regulator